MTASPAVPVRVRCLPCRGLIAVLRTGAGSKTIGGAIVRMFGATPGSWLVRGYVDAVERFREQAAIGADSAREVYPPLFEALNWAHSLWDTWFRLVEPQDRHLDGLRHVRDRCLWGALTRSGLRGLHHVRRVGRPSC